MRTVEATCIAIADALRVGMQRDAAGTGLLCWQAGLSYAEFLQWTVRCSREALQAASESTQST